MPSHAKRVDRRVPWWELLPSGRTQPKGAAQWRHLLSPRKEKAGSANDSTQTVVFVGDRCYPPIHPNAHPSLCPSLSPFKHLSSVLLSIQVREY